ncbi:MAG: phosphoribosylformylglycinamidine synthase subunit PurQ, partial [Pseudomonadota bacterium]
QDTAVLAQNARNPVGRAVDRVLIPKGDAIFCAEPDTLRALSAEDRIAFRYQDPINGSADRIAGILSENRRVLGMMPHPERAADPATGLSDGARLFAGLAGAFEVA